VGSAFELALNVSARREVEQAISDRNDGQIGHDRPVTVHRTVRHPLCGVMRLPFFDFESDPEVLQ
jgi:hypothetical protein